MNKVTDNVDKHLLWRAPHLDVAFCSVPIQHQANCYQLFPRTKMCSHSTKKMCSVVCGGELITLECLLT
jgi:hypothetical protein